MKTAVLSRLLILLLLVAAVGCANPAADAPEAEVQEATETPVAETMTEETTDYALGGTIEFVGSKVTGSHDGGFESFEGEVSVVGDQIVGSSVEVTIDTTSLWSDSERLTGHLKSEDFFAVETYPTASFQSTEIAANEDGTFTMTGNLDLHGVQKQIAFPAEISLTDSGFTAKAEFSLKRFDFGIEYPGKADDLIRDEVLVRLDLTSDMGGDDEMTDGGEPAEDGEESEGS